MKRSSLPRRKSFLKRGTKPIKRGAPPRKLNVEASKKRSARRQEERQSASWRALRKQVRERSGGRCERIIGTLTITSCRTGHAHASPWRCHRAATDVHHVRYTKARAREALTDLLHVCRECHATLEAEHPHRASRRKALALARAGGETS